MAVRLKDIAEKIGVSVNTVSCALNGKGHASEKLTKQILETAKEMGYTPNIIGRALRSGRTNVIAVILNDYINPFFSIIADEISTYSTLLNYNVIMYTSSGDVNKERKLIDDALSQNVCGIILYPSRNSIENIRYMKKQETPFILLGKYFEDLPDVSYVAFEEIRAGFIAAEYLLGLDKKKVLTIIPDDEYSTDNQRLSGIVQAFTTYGILYDTDKYCHSVSSNFRIQQNEIKKIIREAVDFEAVICYDDIIAYRVSNLVPNDVKIIGFGNIRKKLPFCQNIISIDTEGKNLSIESVDALLELVNNNKSKVQCLLPVSLVMPN